MKMPNLTKVIQKHGGWEILTKRPIKLELGGYEPLVIQHLGVYARRFGQLLSVMHYYEQNGDIMRDPEVVFSTTEGFEQWCPVEYILDSLAVRQKVLYVEYDKVYEDPQARKDVESFCRVWDRNIKEQGWLESAKSANVLKEV